MTATEKTAKINIHCEPKRKKRYMKALTSYYQQGTKLSDVINPIVFKALDEWADGILGEENE